MSSATRIHTVVAATDAEEGAREFSFTDHDFATIRTLVKHHTGINLSPAKRNMVYSRLTRRLRQLALNDFASYCERLKQGDAEEFSQFINAITTNLTSFFREPHHFDYLAKTVIPELLSKNKLDQRIRIWSAGCSTGEEPYSISITILEALRGSGGWDVKVLATDLDTDVVAHAERGVYSQERLSGLTLEQLRKWFLKGTQGNSGMARIGARARELISFRQLNLMESWPMRGPFDVIFCRNVVIYFDKETQRVLFERFANYLADGGYLFIGHSETLYQISNRFELIGNTIYRKIA